MATTTRNGSTISRRREPTYTAKRASSCDTRRARCSTPVAALGASRSNSRGAGSRSWVSKSKTAMLTTARKRAPEIEWITHDLRTLDLGRTFDVVVLAGNVPLFTPAGTQPELIAGCARHVAPGGVLICGFQTRPRLRARQRSTPIAPPPGSHSPSASRPGTAEPFAPGGDYAVSVTVSRLQTWKCGARAAR